MELELAGSKLMLADEFPDMGCVSPQRLGGPSVTLTLYVDDVDAVTKQAEQAGVVVQRAPEDQFYGERVSHLVDPFGHKWSLHTPVRNMTDEEIKRAGESLGAG